MPTSVFADLRAKAWPLRYRGRLHVATLCGGVPADEKTAIAWVTAKVKHTRSASEIEDLVLQTMAELKMTQDQAIAEVANKRLAGTSMFKQDARGLYIEGRQLKSALKEAVSVTVAAGQLPQRGWGRTNKGLLSYFSEHVFVREERLYLHRAPVESVADLDVTGEPVVQPDGTLQKLIHTFRGDAISYEEYVQEVNLDFTVETDHSFTHEEWGLVWLHGENEGIGASRSQGFGRYEIVAWEPVKAG